MLASLGTYEITDLQADTEYTLNIVAQAEDFTDSDAASTTFRTLQTLLDRPVVQIDEVTIDAIQVSWTAQAVEGLMYRAEIEEEEEELQSYEAVAASQASSELSGLQTGTRYTLRVVASATGYRSNDFETSFATQLASPELMVEDAEEEDGSRMTQSVVLTWMAAVSNASTYELSLRLGGATESLRTEMVEALALSYEFGGLEAGTSYEVLAVAQGYGYPESEAVQVTFKTLDGELAIPQVSIADIDVNSATIEWDAVDNAEEYTVSIEGEGIDDGSHPEVFVSGATRSSEVINLQEGTEYTVTLEARADEYRSSSVDTTFTTLIRLAMPVLVLVVDETTLTLSWAEIDNATTYEVNLYLGEGTEGELVDSNNLGSEVSVDFTGLFPATTYTVEVTALAEQNSGYADSEASVLETATEKLTLPTPTDAEIWVSVIDNTIRVEVTGLPSAYSDLYPAGILNYRVSLELENARVGDDLTLVFPEGGEVVQVFENLEPETEYEVVVVASSLENGGEDLFNDSVAARFSITTGGFVQLQAPIINIENINATGATIEWLEVENAMTYTVSVLDTDGNQVGDDFVLGTAVGSQELTGLMAVTEYVVRVVASAPRYRSRETTQSFTTLQQQLPVPRGISVSPDARSATVSWTANMQGATTYLLSIAELEEQAQEVLAETEGSFSFEDLAPDTTYSLSVVAEAEGMRASEPYTQSFTTLQEQLLVENLEATAVEAQVMVSWTADERASEYVVTVYEQQGETSMFAVMAIEFDNEHEFTGSSVTSYTITVVAQGDGYRASEPAQVEAITERVVLPAIPSTEVMVSATDDSVSVSWEASRDARIAEYVLSIRPDTNTVGELTVDARQAGSRVFANLLENTGYRVMIRSLGNSDLYLSDSERSVQTIPTGTGTKLPTPRITDIVEDETTVQVLWDISSIGSGSSYVLSINGREGATTVPSSLGTYEITDLQPDTEYTLNIVAQAEGFIDSDETSITFTTLQILLEMPVVQIERVTTTSVSLTWDAQEVEDLMYRISVFAGESEIAFNEGLANLEEAEITGLEAGTSYTLRVVASAAGYRSNDFETSFATQLTSPELMVEDAEAEDGSRMTQSVILIWAEAVKSASTYELSLSRIDGEGDTRVETVAASVLEVSVLRYELIGLEAGISYELSVVAQGEGYPDSEAVQLTFKTLDGELTIPQVSIVSVDVNSATIEWDAVDNAEEYTVSIEGEGIDDVSHPEMVFASGATRSSEVINLQSGAEYTVTLEARAEEYRNSSADATFTTLIRLAMPVLGCRGR